LPSILPGLVSSSRAWSDWSSDLALRFCFCLVPFLALLFLQFCARRGPCISRWWAVRNFLISGWGWIQNCGVEQGASALVLVWWGRVMWPVQCGYRIVCSRCSLAFCPPFEVSILAFQVCPDVLFLLGIATFWCVLPLPWQFVWESGAGFPLLLQNLSPCACPSCFGPCFPREGFVLGDQFPSSLPVLSSVLILRISFHNFASMFSLLKRFSLS
jgi:hypothetical protein